MLLATLETTQQEITCMAHKSPDRELEYQLALGQWRPALESKDIAGVTNKLHETFSHQSIPPKLV